MPSICVLFLVAAALCVVAAAFERHKIETMLPMRDGVKLHTLIFLPRQKDGKTKFPAIVDR